MVGILRRPDEDAPLILCAILHLIILILFGASWPVVALGIWWNSNTVSHYFIHRPFFNSRRLNRCFQIFESMITFVPQSLWRERHLCHHSNTDWKFRFSKNLISEITAIALFSIFLRSFSFAGVGLGLFLCYLQGYFEHYRGTVSHYGRWYNLIFFNDGLHVEHHRYPGLGWKSLETRQDGNNPSSLYPPFFRWFELFSLNQLEKWAMRSKMLRSFLLHTHQKAFSRALTHLPIPKSVAIVGGGLFPRTVLVLRELLPQSSLTVIDLSGQNISVAESFAPKSFSAIEATYCPIRHRDFDLVILPLALQGNRQTLIERIPGTVISHEWIWTKNRGIVISRLLFKKLVIRCGPLP